MKPRAQTTSTVLLIRPSRFGANPETAASNAFQRSADDVAPDALRARARTELDGLAQTLAAHDVSVLVLDQATSCPSPDAVFPNNWFSTHDEGTLVLYPMESALRRTEVRRDLPERLAEAGCDVRRVVDLTGRAARGTYLEGTGSLVLDRENGVAWGCRSSRTSPALAEELGRTLGWETALFSASDGSGRPVYHTNVLLAIGRTFAVACLEAIDDARERETLERTLTRTGREVLAITRAQMGSFAGNVLELATRAGAPVIVLSETAHRGFTDQERGRLAAHGRLVPIPIPTIEHCGGGSVRCMIAEIFLPMRDRPRE